MAIPVFVLAGQSNAANLSSEIRASLADLYGVGGFELVRVHSAGSPLTRQRDEQTDWNHPTELRQELLSATNAALDGGVDRSFGGLIWVQGEADTFSSHGAQRYGQAFENFISEFFDGLSANGDLAALGQGPGPVAILELSNHAPEAGLRAGWDLVIQEQREVATRDPFIRTIDPDSVAVDAGFAPTAMFRDALHYSSEVSQTLADALVHALSMPPEGAREVRGGPADDVLTGSGSLIGEGGNDTLLAGAQDDQLSGGFGDDTLNGGAGSDLLRGGPGADLLIGAAGADDLRGGSGHDTVSYADALSAVNLDMRERGTLGEATGDTYISIERILGSEFADYIYGNSAANVLVGGAGDDRIRGDGGDDHLLGGAGNDQIIGGSGRDRIDGNDGDDLISGGAQNDHLRGHAGQDHLWGEGGRDYVSGGGGQDHIFGGDARDFLFGGQGNDHLSGDGGSDRLYGQSGDDHLYGGAQTDWLYGGIGEDVFVFSLGSDKDVLRDFEDDVDTIQIDNDLWQGTKTVEDLLHDFGQSVGSDVVFDFGFGNVLVVENTNFSALSNDIEMI